MAIVIYHTRADLHIQHRGTLPEAMDQMYLAHALRHDLALQTAVDRDRPLASAPTLCRFENRADRRTAWTIQEVLVEQGHHLHASFHI